MNQTTLQDYGVEIDLSKLTAAERKAYVAVRMNGVGPREHARATDRSPGTISNLLRRAERKLGVRD